MKQKLIAIHSALYACHYDPCGFDPEAETKETLISILKNHNANARAGMDLVEVLLENQNENLKNSVLFLNELKEFIQDNDIIDREDWERVRARILAFKNGVDLDAFKI